MTAGRHVIRKITPENVCGRLSNGAHKATGMLVHTHANDLPDQKAVVRGGVRMSGGHMVQGEHNRRRTDEFAEEKEAVLGDGDLGWGEPTAVVREDPLFFEQVRWPIDYLRRFGLRWGGGGGGGLKSAGAPSCGPPPPRAATSPRIFFCQLTKQQLSPRMIAGGGAAVVLGDG